MCSPGPSQVNTSSDYSSFNRFKIRVNFSVNAEPRKACENFFA